MDLGLARKRALVTGASRGLGRAIALGLAREGAAVVPIARDGPGLNDVVEQMGGEQAGHHAIALDLMADGAIDKVQEALTEHDVAVDIMVHNLGGTLGARDPLGEVSDYERVWRFNVGVAVGLNRVFLPGMLRRKWGRIVHVSSSAAVTADASLPYSSSKAALNAYSKGLGHAVAKDGVVVTAIMPGPFAYEGSRWDRASREDPARFQEILGRVATGRMGNPEEIADLVVFLCSERATFLAGAVLPIDGGIGVPLPRARQ